uniref:uncharacterized protein LOC101297920 n=1 Tax=Fragaria vesca subsp. vesca TaxID=101020 RepID=UPI0005C93B60|nr:PREDICTED: uncharacterized protein LOC101297920 [Fragaria vesca subsp. vesca]
MSDYLPEPMIEKILLNMPTKCLMKYTAVCKSWMSLIKSSTIIQTHLTRNNNARLLLFSTFSKVENTSKSYSLLWDDPVLGDCKRIDPITYTIVYQGRNVSPQSLLVVGTCNGLFYDAPVFVNINGCPHWYADELYHGFEYILSFDMTSWCTKYGDCLALATEKISLEFDIWVMKEYGVAESWTKLTLRHEGDLDHMEELIYCRSEELVFQSETGNLLIVDCGTG